jgi:hypothetical protein
MDELKTIKEYLPKSYSKFLKLYKHISEKSSSSLSSAVNDKELDRYIKDHVINLNLKVNYIKTDEIDVFTYPFLPTPELNKNRWMNDLPILSDVYKINNIYLELLKANIDATGDIDGVVTFTYKKLPSNFILSVYQTSGAYTLLKHDIQARFAIMMHEVGHWYSVNPYIATSVISILQAINIIFGIIGAVTIGFLVILVIVLNAIGLLIINYIDSVNEENCDRFVKKIGYGPQLARGLFNLKYGNNSNLVEMDQDRFLQIMQKFSSKLTDFLNRINYGYPSTNRRIQIGITESIFSLSLEVEFKDLITSFDNFFA